FAADGVVRAEAGLRNAARAEGGVRAAVQVVAHDGEFSTRGCVCTPNRDDLAVGLDQGGIGAIVEAIDRSGDVAGAVAEGGVEGAGGRRAAFLQRFEAQLAESRNTAGQR